MGHHDEDLPAKRDRNEVLTQAGRGGEGGSF